LLLVWGVFGKSVGAWWELSGASKGLRAASFLRLRSAAEGHLDATGGHLVGTSVGRRHLS
jgi:hypothetical protein